MLTRSEETIYCAVKRVCGSERASLQSSWWADVVQSQRERSHCTGRLGGGRSESDVRDRDGWELSVRKGKGLVLLVYHLDWSLVSFPLCIIRWMRGCVSWLPVAGALGQTELSREPTGRQWVWTPETEPTEKHAQVNTCQVWSVEAQKHSFETYKHTKKWQF